MLDMSGGSMSRSTASQMIPTLAKTSARAFPKPVSVSTRPKLIYFLHIFE
jgi:hypothetical protein